MLLERGDQQWWRRWEQEGRRSKRFLVRPFEKTSKVEIHEVDQE